MARKITAHEATVHTATVEVRTLTISGRQVTLSVFRQLEKEDIIDLESMKLSGVPWGRVNYHPEKACDEPGHLHVVWQKGDELRRACVLKNHLKIFEWDLAELHDSRLVLDRCFLAWFMLAAAASPGDVGRSDGKYTIRHGNHDYRISQREYTRTERDGGNVWYLAALEVARLLYSADSTDAERIRYSRQSVARAAAQLLHHEEGSVTVEAAESCWTTATRKLQQQEATLKASIEQYDALYAGLLALPQLFIAT